jgi:hypothetical protein
MMKRGGVFLAGANFTGTGKIYGRRDVVGVSIEFSSLYLRRSATFAAAFLLREKGESIS